ncbi:MAG: hypothetical protein IKZ82_05890 [Clostridia bacterium]|nr:hypothetical protein [Clostridia bacterium]
MGQSRNENILENMLGKHNELGKPQSRIEQLLMWLLEQGGGGGTVRERYSVGEELLIGEWTDGEKTYDLYRKVIDFGQLTNATLKQVLHGIAPPFIVTRISGIAKANGNNLPLPLVANDSAKNIYLAVGTNNVTISPNSDRSNYTATVVIEYYKPSA